jgi:hypothetical protein
MDDLDEETEGIVSSTEVLLKIKLKSHNNLNANQ